MATFYRHWFPCTITPEMPHGKGYTGYTYQTIEERDRQRFKPSAVSDSVGLKRAIVKYGKENMQTDIIEEILPIHDLVKEREKFWIAHFDDYHNGYNRTKGGEGVDPETASETNRKRVKDGTHHFIGGEIARKHSSETQRKRVADGTHNLLGENNPVHKRVADGTHNLLGGEIARETQRKRVADGTHNFIGGDIQRKNNHKRVADGTHQFLGGEIARETSRKRVADGTHNFLGGEIARETNRKRVADGTHNFLAKNRCPEVEKRRIKGIRKTMARKKAERLAKNTSQKPE